MNPTGIKLDTSTVRHIEAINLYSFPGLETGLRPHLGSWRWHKMTELDRVVSMTLRSYFGFLPKDDDGSGILKMVTYHSFRPEYLSWITKQRRSKMFSWLESYGDLHEAVTMNTSGPVTVWYDTEIDNCPFEEDSVYVPAGWGIDVIKLAQSGIIALSVRAGMRGEVVIGITAGGEEADPGVLRKSLTV